MTSSISFIFKFNI